MKYVTRFITTGLAAGAFMLPVVTSANEAEIAERIKPVGQVCVEGQECTQQVAAAGGDAAAAAGLDIAGTYTKTCGNCHGAGVAGAPRLGNPDDWAPRIAKGMDALYQSGINGLAPGMPAKGMCFTCSDDDIKSLVDYMVNESR